MRVYGEEDISADNKGFEVFGSAPNASLKVTAADTYTVNSTAIEAAADDVIVGTLDDSARLYDEHIIDFCVAQADNGHGRKRHDL